MKVSYNWLKEFVDVAASPEEVASRLALSGTNIASIENGAHGAVIDAEITSNRPDCLGMLGIAREVGAIYRLPVKVSSPKPAESKTAKAGDALKVKIEVPELCGRFTARAIRGVKIQPSPKWLGARASPSHLSLRSRPRSQHRRSMRQARRKNENSRRRRAHIRPRCLRGV